MSSASYFASLGEGLGDLDLVLRSGRWMQPSRTLPRETEMHARFVSLHTHTHTRIHIRISFFYNIYIYMYIYYIYIYIYIYIYMYGTIIYVVSTKVIKLKLQQDSLGGGGCRFAGEFRGRGVPPKINRLLRGHCPQSLFPLANKQSGKRSPDHG